MCFTESAEKCWNEMFFKKNSNEPLSFMSTVFNCQSSDVATRDVL